MVNDCLSEDWLNNLPQLFLVRFCGDKTWWPVYDIAVDVGLLRIDVCGRLQAKSFSEVMLLRDADGDDHNPDEFWLD